MGSLFSNKQKTSSSGTSDTQTQNNLWSDPNLQNFLQGYNQTYSNAGNFNVPTNSYQTGAADQQTGVAAGLQPAQTTANTVGQNGITQSAIQSYMSPYIQNVVDPTIQAQNLQNQQALSNLRGNQAAKGALGNNTGSEAAYMAGVQPAQQAQIAGLYNQGYGQATNTAAQSAGLQLQGAQTSGQLANSATNANSALGQMGQNIWNSSYQNAMTPYTLYNQGIQGYQGFGNLAGTNTNTQTTGNQTQTSTPSPFSMLGAGLSLFSDEKLKDNVKRVGETYDGLPIYTYTMGGGPTQMGLMAQDVEQRKPEAVGEQAGFKTVNYDTATQPVMQPFNNGGSVGGGNTFADKVAKAHEVVQKMRASGGRTESKREDSGAGRFAQPRMDPWHASATPYYSDRLPVESSDLGSVSGLMAYSPGRMMPLSYSYDEPLVPLSPRGYDEGGSVLPEAFTPFGGFNPSNTTAMGPAFAGNPFAQFMPSGGEGPPLGPETTGQMFEAGADPLTSANVMDVYNPNGPLRVPNAATPPPINPSATPLPMAPSRDVAVAARREREMPLIPSLLSSAGISLSPGMQSASRALERFGMAAAAQSPQMRGYSDNILAQDQARIQEAQAERAAQQLAQQLAHQNAQQAMQQQELEHRRATLAEQERHHRATELNRNQNRPETAYQVGMANAAVKDVTERSAAIRAGTAQLERLGQMEALIKDPNVRQGAWANWELEGKKAAQALGFNMQGVPESEALRALSNQIALQLRNPAGGEGMPGAMSDADRNFLVASVPGLTITDQGNRALIKIMQDKERYRIAQNREAIRYVQQNHTNDGLEQHMQRWAEVNPMISRETRREAERLAAQSPAPAGPNQAQTPNFGGYTREQLAAMPEGPVMTPQGQPTGLIRRGNELIPVQGEVGTQGNPHPRLADATQPGQYAYDKGKLYRRTNNMFTNRWEEVTQ